MRARISFCLLFLLAACAPTARGPAPLEPGPVEVVLEAPVFQVLPTQTEIEFFNPPGMGGVLQLGVGVRIVNPNSVPLTLQDSDYTVYAWGREVAHGRLTTSATLAPGAGQLETLRVAINVEKQPELLQEVRLALRGAPLPLRFEGRLQVRALDRNLNFGPLAFLTMQVTDKKTAASPVLHVMPAGSRLSMPQKDIPVAQILLEVHNPGEVGYYLFGQSLLLLLDEKPLAVADLQPIAIPAKATRTVELVFYPNLQTLSPETRTLLAGALSGVPMAFSVEGQLRLDILGVGTYDVAPQWRIQGFISGDDQ
ncbi:MAG TPA: LEA type 2 family protein [Trueperaceae bacterium]